MNKIIIGIAAIAIAALVIVGIINLRPAEAIEVIPVEHASAILRWDNTLIYADPVGESERYAQYPNPDLVLITHEHPDHLDLETLAEVLTESSVLVIPPSVAEQLPENLPGTRVVLENDEVLDFSPLTITAIPAYNIREEALQNHPEGRDNGYILSGGETRVYFSGDSGPTKEMRSLQNIDMAFVAMNLPYTMSVEDAADAVLDFAPKVVYPYHFRTPEGFSDVNEFERLVREGDRDITVSILDWYPE